MPADRIVIGASPVSVAKSAARTAANGLHRIIASRPGIARHYLRTVGWLTRPLPDGLNKNRIVNTLRHTEWPDVPLPNQAVRLGQHHIVRLVPHVGEFDFEALFCRELAYECEVFALLEERLSQYDAIIEIGANVGVFTTYFAAACTGAQMIFAFEPSTKAFARLTENLSLNGATRVRTFNLAVAERAGDVPFFEPAGHGTNGSLKREFASVFSNTIEATTVQAVDGRFLVDLVAPYRRLLIKIDVEGAEAEVLRGLAPLVAAANPDFVIEVLECDEEALNMLELIRERYRLFSITSEGLIEKRRFEAHAQHRDYLLVPRER